MTSTFSIILFFLGLLGVILIHELAHFLVARRYGFKVEEYFVGFGPKIWSFKRGEIEYGVKALPLGGYVKIAGMNPYQPVAPEDLPRAYGSKPRWQRALVIFAGPASHFLVAFVLIFAVLALRGDPTSTVPVVGEVVPALNGHPSPAATAGLRPADVIVGVGDVSDPTQGQLLSYTTKHVGTPVVFTIDRGAQTLHITMTPESWTPPGSHTPIGRIGILLTGWEPIGVGRAFTRTFGQVGSSIAGSAQQATKVFGPEGIGRVFNALFTNSPRDVGGPASVLGVGRAVGKAGQQGGLALVFYSLAYVTIFIGLLNLLPLPPFDGGHLAVLAIERARGKAIDMRKLVPISAAVILFLGVYVVATVLLDIAKPLPLSP